MNCSYRLSLFILIFLSFTSAQATPPSWNDTKAMKKCQHLINNATDIMLNQYAQECSITFKNAIYHFHLTYEQITQDRNLAKQHLSLSLNNLVTAIALHCNMNSSTRTLHEKSMILLKHL